ncbi:ABC transporter substrate-binding protein [Flavimaricola marinus]|uniref:Glutathione-binding protein GsiB n=1 Tax=Flavimaricola marinus TaxID=1819565 RepID=A0A238LGR8_9RHOB|nr:ABC transporter substrate-binding protein [Flavimaricola marinus]SMY08889.1 Glutathione-binding protein GsiB precursor [Flavimaricola marinus]
MNKLLRTSAIAIIAAQVAGGVSAQAINESELSDPRVRQAIAYAIDMETIAETLFEGAAIPALGLTSDANNYPEGMNSYSYDPDKARELLAEAGWDGSRTLDMVYYYPDQLTADFMAVVQAQLGDVGIDMTYRLLEGDVGAQISGVPDDPVNGPSVVDWDILYGARAAIANQEYFNRFAEGEMPTVPTVDALVPLVESVNATVNPAVQRAGFQEMEGIINENVYILPLYYQQLYIFESDRINRNGAPYGNEQYNYNFDVVNWTVEPNEDGELVAYTNGAPMQFFELPWQNLGIWVHSRYAFDTILEADGTLTPIGGELAETYEVIDDGMTFTFTLKDDLKWHDGTPITAADVKWSIEAAAQAPITHPVVSTTLSRIEGAEALASGDADGMSGVTIDGNTVTIKFAVLDPNVLLTFSQFAPLPMAYFEGTDPLQIQQNEFWQKPIGSGPFMIEEARMNEFTTLVPFPDYHGGVAKIEQIIALPSADGDANLIRNAAAFRADFGYTKNATDVPSLEEMEHMTVRPVNIPYTRMFWINQFPRG